MGNFSGSTRTMDIAYSLSMMNGFHHHGYSKEMMEWMRSRFLMRGPMDIQILWQIFLVVKSICCFIGVTIYKKEMKLFWSKSTVLTHYHHQANLPQVLVRYLRFHQHPCLAHLHLHILPLLQVLCHQLFQHPTPALCHPYYLLLVRPVAQPYQLVTLLLHHRHPLLAFQQKFVLVFSLIPQKLPC